MRVASVGIVLLAECLLVTLVVLMVAKLAVEMQVDGMGCSNAMTLMIDFREAALIKGVVAEFDTSSTEGETDFVELVLEADGAVLADGAGDAGLEEFFERLGVEVELTEVFGVFLEAGLGALAGAAVGACVVGGLDPVGELGVEGF